MLAEITTDEKVTVHVALSSVRELRDLSKIYWLLSLWCQPSWYSSVICSSGGRGLSSTSTSSLTDCCELFEARDTHSSHQVTRSPDSEFTSSSQHLGLSPPTWGRHFNYWLILFAWMSQVIRSLILERHNYKGLPLTGKYFFQFSVSTIAIFFVRRWHKHLSFLTAPRALVAKPKAEGMVLSRRPQQVPVPPHIPTQLQPSKNHVKIKRWPLTFHATRSDFTSSSSSQNNGFWLSATVARFIFCSAGFLVTKVVFIQSERWHQLGKWTSAITTCPRPDARSPLNPCQRRHVTVH